MITETPSPTCISGGTPLRRNQMAKARGRVRVCARARVTGVAFFDFPHGQTGVAANAIELHPVLAFHCLSGTAPAPGAAPTPKAGATASGSSGKKCELG